MNLVRFNLEILWRQTREIWVKQHDYLQDFSTQRPKRLKIAFVVKNKFSNLKQLKFTELTFPSTFYQQVYLIDAKIILPLQYYPTW